MPARKTPSQGSKPDKRWRDAIALAVTEEDATGKPILRSLAERLVLSALSGDVTAMKEVGDRLDGKPPQAMALQHEVGDTLAELMQMIDGRNRRVTD